MSTNSGSQMILTPQHHVTSRSRAPHRRGRVGVKLHGVDVSRNGLQTLRGILDTHQQPMHLEPELPLCPLQLVQQLLAWNFKLAVSDEELWQHNLVLSVRPNDARGNEQGRRSYSHHIRVAPLLVRKPP